MDTLNELHNHYGRKLETIPVADPQAQAFNEMAGVDKLKDYGPLALIDTLVLRYPAYNHDQIFNLSLGLVYELLCIGKERDRITAGASRMRRKSIK